MTQSPLRVILLSLCGTLALACGGSADEVAENVASEAMVNGTGAPGLILTFDDGPRTYAAPVAYKSILDGSVSTIGSTADFAEWLHKKGVKATFFMVGTLVKNPGGAAELQRVAAAGHTIANHTFSHYTSPRFGRRPLLEQEEEIQLADDALFGDKSFSRNLARNAAGKEVIFLRTPAGSWDKTDAPALNAKFGARYVGPIHWDIGGDAPAADYACWAAQKSVDACAQLYRADIEAHGGKGIVLLRDSNGSSALLAMRLVEEQLKSGKKFYSLQDAPRVRSMMNSTTGFSETFSLPDGRGGDAAWQIEAE